MNSGLTCGFEVEWFSFLKGLLWYLALPLLQEGQIFVLLSQFVRQHMRDLIYDRVPAVAFWASNYPGADFVCLFKHQQLKGIGLVNRASQYVHQFSLQG